MNKLIISILILFFLITNNTIAEENIMILKLKDGDVKIELFEDVAPNHVRELKSWQMLENTTMLFFIELSMVLWLKLEMFNLVTLLMITLT